MRQRENEKYAKEKYLRLGFFSLFSWAKWIQVWLGKQLVEIETINETRRDERRVTIERGVWVSRTKANNFLQLRNIKSSVCECVGDRQIEMQIWLSLSFSLSFTFF